MESSQRTDYYMRRLKLVPLVSLALLAGSFMETLTHELIGHGLVGVLLGYDFYALYVSPLGTSETYVNLTNAPAWKEGLVSAGGIVSGILLGLILLSFLRIIKKFTPKLLLFFWAEESLIGNSTYLASSSLASFLTGEPNGDPYWISYYYHIPLALLASVGIALTLIFYYFLFKNLALLLIDIVDYVDRNDMFSSVAAIWILGLLPLRLASAALEGEVSTKAIMFLSTAAAILLTGKLASQRLKWDKPATPRPLEFRQVLAISLAATLAVEIWLGAFGPTVDTAHGLIIREFPYYVNVRITLYENLTADVQLAFRPGPFKNAWPGLRDKSPTWDQYLNESIGFMRTMFGTNGSQLIDHFTDNESFWYSGAWHLGGARVIHMRVPMLQAKSTAYGELYLVLNDPWKPGGFIDGLNVTLIGLHLRSSTPPTKVLYSEMTESGAWLNNSTDTSPSQYSLLLVEIPS
jgi:hypothetical protein